jgi:hypothetical protein
VLLLVPALAFGASVTIPTFQLLTRGILADGEFSLQTSADLEIELGGGYKFGGQLSLAMTETNLEQASSPAAVYDPDNLETLLNRSLQFKAASVVVRDTFTLPFDTTYFVGEVDRLLTGDLFTEHFGSDIVASDFRGLLYFPTGVVYNGLHAINGTGVAVTFGSLWQSMFLQGALYQDGYLGLGTYSADVRFAFSSPKFKTEVFLGGTLPAAQWGAYRAGALLFYDTGVGGEVLLQLGIPRWAPATDGLPGIEDFFLRFEPRVNISFMSIVLSLFWHPAYYLQIATDEAGIMDIAVQLIAGNVQEAAVSGGLESVINLEPLSPDATLRLTVSPFVSLNASGVIWDIKANFKVLPFDASNLFDAFIGVRTAF